MFIANRTLERAERLASLSIDSGVAAEGIELSQAADAATEVSLIVNCTSMGMVHGPTKRALRCPPPTFLPQFWSTTWCIIRRKHLCCARRPRPGAATLGGIQMLVYQGAASFEMWTGQPAPVPVMLEAAIAAMRARG